MLRHVLNIGQMEIESIYVAVVVIRVPVSNTDLAPPNHSTTSALGHAVNDERSPLRSMRERLPNAFCLYVTIFAPIIQLGCGVYFARAFWRRLTAR